MVDASSLSDYEVWIFIASLICNFLVGFVVGAITNTNKDSDFLYGGIIILLVFLFIISLIMAYRKRLKMTLEENTIKMGAIKSE